MHGQAMAVCIVTVEFAELGVLDAELFCAAAVGCVLFPEQPQGDSRLQKLLVDIAIVRHSGRDAWNLIGIEFAVKLVVIDCIERLLGDIAGLVGCNNLGNGVARDMQSQRNVSLAHARLESLQDFPFF